MNNSNPRIINLINDYLKMVKKGVEFMNIKYQKDPTFHLITKDTEPTNKGFLDDQETVSYCFHGISGSIIKWQNGDYIDFSIGRGGRCDGFDIWFVFDFYRRNDHIYTEFEPNTLEEIESEVKRLAKEDLVKYDDLDNLYYFKEDYLNSRPYRWLGGKGSIHFG